MLQISALLLVDHAYYDPNGNVHACGIMDTFTVGAELAPDAARPLQTADRDAVVREAIRRYQKPSCLFVYWRIPQSERGVPWQGRLALRLRGELVRDVKVMPVDTSVRASKWLVQINTLPLLGDGENLFEAYARPVMDPEADWGEPLACYEVQVRLEVATEATTACPATASRS